LRHRAPSWPEKGSEGIGRTTASRAARGGNGRHLAAIAGCLLDPSPRLVWRGCSHDQRGESGSKDVVDIICTILKLIILPCRQRRRVAPIDASHALANGCLDPTPYSLRHEFVFPTSSTTACESPCSSLTHTDTALQQYYLVLTRICFCSKPSPSPSYRYPERAKDALRRSSVSSK
jgi:hypothetical protein